MMTTTPAHLGRKITMTFVAMLALSPMIDQMQRAPDVYAQTAQSAQELITWYQQAPTTPIPNPMLGR